MGKLHLVAQLGLAVILMAAPSRADAQTVSGTIVYPCHTPALTWSGTLRAQGQDGQVLANGQCGWRIDVAGSGSFTVIPSGSSNLDVHSYKADGALDKVFVDDTCGAVSGSLGSSARVLVVVVTPLPQHSIGLPGTVSVSPCADQSNVGFTYHGP